jgi:acyl-CoA dehydrogenase
LGDGSYAITGQKIYISWGDNDFAANVCHLVLARLPDGAPRARGDQPVHGAEIHPRCERATPGARNSLKVVSLEHKLGLHGSAHLRDAV